jgi:hypothetical protein
MSAKTVKRVRNIAIKAARLEKKKIAVEQIDKILASPWHKRVEFAFRIIFKG